MDKQDACLNCTEIQSHYCKRFYMPKYSPDLNPIEQLFAKLKPHSRAAQQRTRETLSDAVADIRATVTPQECSNDFKHDGYGQTKTNQANCMGLGRHASRRSMRLAVAATSKFRGCNLPILNMLTPNECKNEIINAGYERI